MKKIRPANFINYGYDQYLFIFIISFLLCLTVIFLSCFAFSRAANIGISSLFISYCRVDRVSSSPALTYNERSGMKDPCSGRYIYVYDLPRRFNDDILKNCRAIMKWRDVCPYVQNSGLGPEVEDPRGILSNGTWFATDQFFLEPIFRARMRQYKCLTDNSSLASAVYVPYYAGLDVSRHLWGPNTSTRDALARELDRWVGERPEWKRMWGWDHFVVSGRIGWDFRRRTNNDSEWGSNFMNLPGLKNMTLMSIESTPWTNEMAVPYPTYCHPSTIHEVSQWQERMRKRKRKYLFSFAGAARPGSRDSIRTELIKLCQQAPGTCFQLACKSGSRNKCDDPVEIFRVFQDSDFCLQPSGDSYTRRSAFDSILAGCIPVFFHPGSAYGQYSWYFPSNYTKYSVFIPEEEVRSQRADIRHTLMSIPRHEVQAMREEVIRMIPRIVYANPRNGGLADFEDAFEVAINKVLSRMEEVRRMISQGKDPTVTFSNWDNMRFDLPLPV